METNERARRLKSMLAQIAPGESIESVRPAVAPGGLEGLEAVPDETQRTVDRAIEKVAADREQELTPDEMFALEAIVMPENRPVVFVKGASYDDVPAPWEHLNTAEAKTRIAKLLPSIGRVELPTMPRIPYGGTGFVVGTDLLMTNRHVARLFSDGVGSKIRYTRGDAEIDFAKQIDSPAGDRTRVFDVLGVVMVHPYWDMALLRIKGLTDHVAPLRLSVRTPEELVDRDVVAIGYPARDDRSDLALQDRIFAGKYNVKRLQPGKIRPRGRIRSFETIVDAMTHDSSTLGGNSGSAVIDIESGEVLGLHFAGEYLKANYAVPAFELARDRRVTALGLNFNGSATPTTDFDAAWTRVSSDEGVTPTPATPQPLQQSPAPPATTVSTATGTAHWTIPLQVSVSIGTPVMTTAPAAAEGIPSARVEAPKMQMPVIFGGLENRHGYEPGFLDLAHGEEVPLPTLTSLGKKVAAKLEDGSTELKYHKFSVVMHKGRRLALFTAANVDWRPQLRLVDGKKPSRDQLTGLAKGQQELWSTDWRIDAAHQLPDIFYTKDGGAFDKGHLVRRDDVAWGTSFKDMQKSNGDTYHTTNCSPQVAGFNRSAEGEDNWGDLENLVQKETKAEKAILFSGPVLDEEDIPFEGRGENGTKIEIRVPRRFWKIVVVNGENGPQAYGFVLEQDLSALEFAVPAAWQKYMRRIEEIEGMLNGLADLTWLREHDAFESEEGVRIASQVQ